MNRFEQVHREIFLRRVRLAAMASRKGKAEPRSSERQHIALADRFRVLELPEAPAVIFEDDTERLA